MARRKKETPVTQAELDDGMTAEDHEALEQEEIEEGSLHGDDAEGETKPPPNPNAARVNKVEEKRVKLPRRNLGGMYRCAARLSHGGVRHMPGTEVKLTDEEARHFLKDGVVEPLD
jgi:hypothetical protein